MHTDDDEHDSKDDLNSEGIGWCIDTAGTQPPAKRPLLSLPPPSLRLVNDTSLNDQTNTADESTHGTVIVADTERSQGHETSIGDAERSQGHETSIGDAERSKGHETSIGDAERSQGHETSIGDTERSKGHETSIGDAERSKGHETSIGDAERSKGHETSIGDAERSKGQETGNTGSKIKRRNVSMYTTIEDEVDED